MFSVFVSINHQAHMLYVHCALTRELVVTLKFAGLPVVVQLLHRQHYNDKYCTTTSRIYNLPWQNRWCFFFIFSWVMNRRPFISPYPSSLAFSYLWHQKKKKTIRIIPVVFYTAQLSDETAFTNQPYEHTHNVDSAMKNCIHVCKLVFTGITHVMFLTFIISI